MLRWEHVYWFYCCNRHQQNVLGMQAQAIGQTIPDNLSLFSPHLPLLHAENNLKKNSYYKLGIRGLHLFADVLPTIFASSLHVSCMDVFPR